MKRTRLERRTPLRRGKLLRGQLAPAACAGVRTGDPLACDCRKCRRARVANGMPGHLLSAFVEQYRRAEPLSKTEALAQAKFQRRMPLPAAGRNPETGRPTCRWCGQDVPVGRRRTWCSEACSDEYWLRVSAGFVRQKVQARDHGVCALCGLDTGALERMAARFRLKTDDLWLNPRYDRATRDRLCTAVEEGFHRWASAHEYHDLTQRHGILFRRHLWEADHVVPISEGGGACGLEGYRTLCWRCHPKETGALRRRLNRQRGKQVQIL